MSCDYKLENGVYYMICDGKKVPVDIDAPPQFKAEKLIFEVISGKGRSQRGDLSKALEEQGFFGNEKPKGLDRDKFLSKGNPVDTLDSFLKQNPN